MIAQELTDVVIGAAIEVHRELGPGLLETIYDECFCHELALRGCEFRRQVEVPIVYKGKALGSPLRIDVLVEETVVVELKAVERLLAVHEAQLLSYLRLTGKRVGLLMNFNVPALRHGLVRRVL